MFARTLQGVTTNIELEKWVAEQFDGLKQVESHENLLKSLWPIIFLGIENRSFQKIDKQEAMLEVALRWIAGASFGAILNELNQKNVRIFWGKQRRELTVENIVDICEGAFGYDGALRVGAIIDLLVSQDTDDDERQMLIQRLSELHKRFKYGLPTAPAVALYECGFADRVVAQHLSELVSDTSKTRTDVISALTEQQNAAEKILEEYPRYFRSCLTGLLT